MNDSHSSFIASIHHDGASRYVQNRAAPGSPPRLGDEITLRLRAAPDAPIQRVLLRTCPDGEQHFIEMARSAGHACQWWEGVLKMSMPVMGYRFLLFTTEGVFWHNAGGTHRHSPTDAEDFRLLADYNAPEWVHGAVFYQIFPDRFADGDPSSNVRTGEFTHWGLQSRARSWGETPTLRGREAMVDFYGGDLSGIQDRLGYLDDLGVNALYLNPIFTARSNHRYDVLDYANVDPHLGGNEALIELRRASRERGMRLMLDIVPNHCGVDHPWFRAAQADPNAETASYFTFHKHPDDYECWLGVKGLPKLNYRSDALRDAMYMGKDSVFRRWLRAPYAIDGWRIDVANMLGRQGADQLGVEVAREIRLAVKQENAEVYLIGENFFDASVALQGDCWDAVMNYAGFTMPLWYWLSRFWVDQHGEPHRVELPAEWSTAALVDTWKAYRAAIPWTIARQQFNLIGSHDTARIHNIVGRDAARHRLAAAVLLTYVGVPSIYYGDEVGLEGENALLARGCMPWDRAAWDTGLLGYYRTLVHFRRSSSALSEGGFQVLATEENTLAYLRDAEDECVIVVAHRGPGNRPASALPVAHGAIADGSEFVELFSGARAMVTNGCLPLPALSVGATIWQMEGGYK